MENMVELRSVTKRFGSFVAVDHVDLQIRGGEFLTLLGPSGCGKTTLLRMISGFETPTEGIVSLAGNDVTHLPPYRRDVNQVFQSYALFPHLNVWDNIAFGLKMARVPKPDIAKRVARVVDMVSLAGMERRKPHELSGGQKQRVALARALVCEPKVLLLDEPLSALDAKLRRAMQIELKRLQTQLGITFVFVTHDQEEALVMSDRIAVVNHGKIEQIGNASDIYHRPATRFVADFIGQANVFEATVQSDDGTASILGCNGGLNLAAPSQGFPPGSRVLVCIRPEKVRLTRNRSDERGAMETTIVEQVFRGATNQLLLRTAGNIEVTAVFANLSTSDSSLQKGDRIYCQLPAEELIVLLV